MSEVLSHKLADLKECIERIREDWRRPSDMPFEQDRVKRQLIIMNLQLAFQNLLDMANHLVRVKQIGWPKNSAETFDLLEKDGLITAEMKTRLQAGMGMRNIMVHRYKKIDLAKVKGVVENHLDDLLDAGQTLFRQGPKSISSQTVPLDGDEPVKPG
ncbi:MAG: DUF86 domain-containing protein [Gammaproteobacteria bacterium]|nr:DUF86 domain-containing protein [Gammaproteobacteria bacterium]MDE0284359.1 DUF86 domain-containing protein [Gammaproteobacteria bacterium]MDE0514002.1 DUF86 domain-containing protein [Gammaproteobacteria bacterium]